MRLLSRGLLHLTLFGDSCEYVVAPRQIRNDVKGQISNDVKCQIRNDVSILVRNITVRRHQDDKGFLFLSP